MRVVLHDEHAVVVVVVGAAAAEDAAQQRAQGRQRRGEQAEPCFEEGPERDDADEVEGVFGAREGREDGDADEGGAAGTVLRFFFRISIRGGGRMKGVGERLSLQYTQSKDPHHGTLDAPSHAHVPEQRDGEQGDGPVAHDAEGAPGLGHGDEVRGREAVGCGEVCVPVGADGPALGDEEDDGGDGAGCVEEHEEVEEVEDRSRAGQPGEGQDEGVADADQGGEAEELED